jgi:hypothetical protein
MAASGAPLEQVLVFETNGPVKNLFDAVKETPGLAWLVDEELTELDPDADFRDAKNAEKKLSARLYMVMTNEVALSQLLGVWNAWKAGGRGKKASAALKLWRPLFGCLRDIRRWEAQDRIEETGIREQWTEDIAIGASSVTIDVRRLDLELGRQVTLDAIWTVRASDGSVVRTGHSVARARAVSGSYDALAIACAKVFGELSEEIARALSAVSPEDIAHKRSQGACGVAEKDPRGRVPTFRGMPAGSPASRTSPASGGPRDCTGIALIRPR